MQNPPKPESKQGEPLFPRLDHIAQARRLLAQELKDRLDPNITEGDLKPIGLLPKNFKNDRYRATFGFSVGTKRAKKMFSIQFQKDSEGNPLFKMNPVEDPSLYRLRLTGQLCAFDKGRCQIERVLEGEDA